MGTAWPLGAPCAKRWAAEERDQSTSWVGQLTLIIGRRVVRLLLHWEKGAGKDVFGFQVTQWGISWCSHTHFWRQREKSNSQQPQPHISHGWHSKSPWSAEVLFESEGGSGCGGRGWMLAVTLSPAVAAGAVVCLIESSRTFPRWGQNYSMKEVIEQHKG